LAAFAALASGAIRCPLLGGRGVQHILGDAQDVVERRLLGLASRSLGGGRGATGVGVGAGLEGPLVAARRTGVLPAVEPTPTSTAHGRRSARCAGAVLGAAAGCGAHRGDVEDHGINS